MSIIATVAALGTAAMAAAFSLWMVTQLFSKD
jgi:hypothetical protein